MDESTGQRVNRWISWALRIGVWSSAALMIAGLLVVWITDSTSPPTGENPSPGELFSRLFSSSADGMTMIFSGLVLLMFTPFLRVLTAAAGFFAERDVKFALVSLCILSMLLGELIFAFR